MTKRILVIEDEAMVTRAVVMVCREENMTVTAVESATEALDCLQERPHRLVLCEQGRHVPGHGKNRLGHAIEQERAQRECVGVACLAGKPDAVADPALDAIDRLSTRPARVLGLRGGTLEVGSPADLVLIDPDLVWKLDPGVLCRCIGVCKEMPDSAPCFGLQDERVVAPLLAEAVAETLSLERKLYASRLAAELSVKFGLDPQPVRKVLWKQEQGVLPPHYQVLVADSLRLLEKEADSPPSYALNWSELQLSDLLPEHKPRAVVGGDYTVRRPIPKLGRNDPCHCGSGKKYKKCCYGKDQKVLRDASQYAGTTRSELKSRPGLVDDPAVIYDMRPYELKKLKPSELGEHQLLTGYHCALQYGLHELAFDMLVECERRPSEREFDRGHFEDLIERVLEAGDLALAQKIRDHCGADSWYRPHAIQFRFDLLENPERFEPLEHDCRQSVCGIFDETIDIDEPLTRLVYDCASRHPALAIVLARAAIASHPDRDLDNAMLLDVIRDARVDLDLEPWNDPAEPLFDWIEDRNRYKEKTESENEEIQRLAVPEVAGWDYVSFPSEELGLGLTRQALLSYLQETQKTGRPERAAKETTPSLTSYTVLTEEPTTCSGGIP